MSLKVHLPLLRIFEAAGRRQSFQAAAAELNLTPSAVSHAIRKLEQTLGVVLFERSGRSVRLSAEGESLLTHTERAFEELHRGLEQVSARAPQVLRLHCAPSFAAQWLTPRLAEFMRQCPQVDMRLSAGTDYARFDTDDFDADIIYGLPRQDGVHVLPLSEETLTPLCAPHIAQSIEVPADILRHPLIQSDNKQIRWPAWFGLNGLQVPSLRGSRFDRSFLAIAAAANGLGVALESTLLAEREIARGRLVAPLAGRSKDPLRRPLFGLPEGTRTAKYPPDLRPLACTRAACRSDPSHLNVRRGPRQRRVGPSWGFHVRRQKLPVRDLRDAGT